MKINRRRCLPLCLFTGLAISCGKPELFVEVDLPRVCITTPNITFLGAPLGASLDQKIDVPIDEEIPFADAEDAQVILQLGELTITPKGGTPDLSGIDTIQISLEATSDLPEKNVFSYKIDLAADAPQILVIRGDPIDIIPYVLEKKVKIRIVAIGKPPSTSWTADVKVCMAGKNRVPYLEL